MKTSDKIWIFIGFLLLSVILGYTIYAAIYFQKAKNYLQNATNYNVTHLQKTIPEVYHIKCQFDTKDDVLVSFDCSYFAVFGDDPYKDDPYKNKEMCIKFISSEVLHEIFYDLCLVDYLQKKDEILYDIRQNLTTKVIQRFPDIEFQVLNITMVFDLNS